MKKQHHLSLTLLKKIIQSNTIYKKIFFYSEAGKITGMIIDLGLDEMNKLLNQRDKLKKVCKQAYEVFIPY